MFKKSGCRPGGDSQNSKHTSNHVSTVELSVYVKVALLQRPVLIWWMGTFSLVSGMHLPLCSCLTYRVAVATQHGEGSSGPRWGTYGSAGEELNYSDQCETQTHDLGSWNLHSLFSHNQMLSPSKPRLHATSSFIYVFIHSSLVSHPPFSNDEHWLWASTIPGSRYYQTARGKRSLLSHA